jgi:hypothetical protein
MHRKNTARTDRAPRVTYNPPWVVTAVRALPGHQLDVRFVDGTSGRVDVSRLAFGTNPGVFEPLRDPAFFERVQVCDGAVTWPGELDLAPDAMYEEIKAHGWWVVPE